MKKFILAAMLLAGCNQPTPTEAPSNEAAGDIKSTQPSSAPTEVADTVRACVERGVAYFKEIGSYPTLSSAPNAGRSAEEVASERCQRTTTAF